MDASEPVRRKRQRLPAIHRYFQLYLFALFVNDVYVFSLIYAFLPSYLLDEGYNTTDLSNAYGADGISNTLGLLVLLYINGIPRVIATSLNTKFLLIVVSTAVCALGSALLTAMPYSYPMLIASKALQGLASSVYFAYSFILTNKLYPLEYQAQTAAVVTAGACKPCSVQCLTCCIESAFLSCACLQSLAMHHYWQQYPILIMGAECALPLPCTPSCTHHLTVFPPCTQA